MQLRNGWTLAEIWVALLLALGPVCLAANAVPAAGQSATVPTTTVQDTVFRADGTPASGTVLIAWPAFVTAAGRTVAAGSTSATIGAGGALSVPLVANSGSTPMGSYYTVVYHLSDGTTSRQYWVVPVSAAPVQVSAIATSVLPASVAMQTVSKAYVDTAIATAVSGLSFNAADFAANTGFGVIGAARGSAFLALDTFYDFSGQTGTTVGDRIGGNNGTLGGATPPTWTGNGLAFTAGSNVALPAALNSEKTFYFAVYLDPITSGAQAANVYPTLLSSITGGTGFNVILQEPGGVLSGTSDYTYTTTLYPNALSTATLNPLSGFAVLTIVCGTGGGNLDHIYIDGVEASYSTQASNCGAQTSGNLYLGSSGVAPWTGGFFPGIFYGFGASSTQHTQAQIQQNVSAFFALANAKGVATSPLPLNLATPQLLAVGDSITAGTNGQTPYTSQLTLVNQPAYTIQNSGIVGIRLSSILSHEANRSAPRCGTQAGPAVALLEAGTNDLASVNPLSPQAVWSEAAAWAALMRKAGCTPFMLTMISRTGTGYNGQTMDSLKDSYDALILQQAKLAGFAGVLDVAANPLLGADNAYANPTYFQSVDHIHPTTLGNGLMAAAVSNGLNWYFGSNEFNPHVLTTLSGFTMACSDGYLDLSGLTAAGNIALPDCTGASGATFRIANPQTAYAVTVTADSAAHPVNGSSGAVTVPAGGTLTLRVVANPKTTSGWHWEY